MITSRFPQAAGSEPFALDSKMKIADVTSGLREGLDPRLLADGFKFRKADHEYVRSARDFRFIFRLGIHAKTDWFLVTPEAFVGSLAINKAFNEILGRSIPTGGSTCGFGIGNEHNHERGRYLIGNEDDIAPVADAILRDYTEVALPFFTEMDSLEAIDRYMNTARDGRCPAGSVSNACAGLIVAKMVGNPKFHEVADRYHHFWAQAQSPALAADILTVKKALQDTTAITKA